MAEITGLCPPQFAPVRDRFAANLDEGLELGARFTASIGGEVVLDLMAGSADGAGTIPFGPETLTPIFSATKAVTAIMIARLVDRRLVSYDTPVAEVWPAFGQAGKDGVTLAQLMSHQAGLAGFSEQIEPTLWFDPPAIVERLAAQAPMWPPGTASGYHPVTIGYLAGEVHRRLDGRSLGQALRQDLAEPFGLDVWIGLPDAEHGRVAQMRKPPAAPDLGPIDAIRRAAFLDRGSAPGGRGSADWRRMEIPSTNGHATAEGLARLMAVVADGGRLDGRPVLSPQTVAELTRARTSGDDRVLPFRLTWAAGLMKNAGQFGARAGPNAVGHFGWGGSMAFADPDRRLSIAYVMNKQSVHLVADPRPLGLTDILYGCL